MPQQQPVRSEKPVKPETLDRQHAELQKETRKPVDFATVDRIHAEQTSDSKAKQ